MHSTAFLKCIQFVEGTTNKYSIEVIRESLYCLTNAIIDSNPDLLIQTLQLSQNQILPCLIYGLSLSILQSQRLTLLQALDHLL